MRKFWKTESQRTPSGFRTIPAPRDPQTDSPLSDPPHDLPSRCAVGKHDVPAVIELSKEDLAYVVSLMTQQVRDIRHENDALKLETRRLEQALAEVTGLEVEWRRLANHDPLTGLPNRLSLLRGIQDAIPMAAEQQTRLALVFIDLDDFKEVNDRHGHAVGDKLLTVVGRRIAAYIRAGDTACRYGGDEFVVLLSDFKDPEVAVAVAEKIRQRIEGYYSIEGLLMQIGASVGLALYPEDGETGAALVHAADINLYQSKLERTLSCRVKPSCRSADLPRFCQEGISFLRLPDVLLTSPLSSDYFRSLGGGPGGFVRAFTWPTLEFPIIGDIG